MCMYDLEDLKLTFQLLRFWWFLCFSCPYVVKNFVWHIPLCTWDVRHSADCMLNVSPIAFHEPWEDFMKWSWSEHSVLIWLCAMDPLGARSQFVDVQTLHRWDQSQNQEGAEVDGPPSGKTCTHEDGLANWQGVFSSPFPFREDINRKIIMLWVSSAASLLLLENFYSLSFFLGCLVSTQFFLTHICMHTLA